MKLSEKLDALQGIARGCAADSRKLYFIGLLAEHAEEAEVDEGFLLWAQILLV